MLALAAALCAAPSRADNAKPAAEALFQEGRSLVLQKRYAEACPKLAESQRLDPGVGTELWLADCYEKSGQTASAWAEFREAAGTAAQRHDDRAAVAQKRADALELRLARLVIVVPSEVAVPGLEIRRDGVLVPASELRIAIPLDPGLHAVSAAAPDRRDWSTTVQLPAERGVVTLNVPLLEAAPVAAPAIAVAPAPPPAAPPEAPAPSGHGQRVAGLALGAVGLVGLGFGAFAGLHAKAVYDGATSTGHCLPDSECDAEGKGIRSSAYGWATGATVAFGVGAAAVVAGAVVFFTAPRGGGGTALRVSAAPGGMGGEVRLDHAW
jgi:serine/threonine-protein kinase